MCPVTECLLCSPEEAARVFGRRTVWQDGLWRLSLVEEGAPVAGFGHLEPKRHIPDITALNGEEAATLGNVLARVTKALKDATAADLVYVYVFGERVAHLHFNLAPHREGDGLAGGRALSDPEAEPMDTALVTRTNREVESLLALDVPSMEL